MGVKETSSEGKAEILYAQNYCIKHVSADIEAFQFNTAIARIMEFTNALYKYADASPDKVISAEAANVLVRLIAPFAPHFAEELWETTGGKYSVFNAEYPVCDESALTLDTMEMPLQINGKLRATFRVPSNATKEDIEKHIMNTTELSSLFADKQVKKVIIIPGKIANIVVA
jgi:leucyl-tRNA synthetase